MSQYYSVTFLGATLRHEGNENSGRYPRGSGKRPYQHMSKLASSTATAFRDINNTLGIVRPKKRTDLSNLSNQELQDTINRLRLENTYRELTGIDRERGKEFIEKALTATASALTVAEALQALSTANNPAPSSNNQGSTNTKGMPSSSPKSGSGAYDIDLSSFFANYNTQFISNMSKKSGRR